MGTGYRLAARQLTTAGAVLAGGERTAGSHGGCASKLTTRPAVPETSAVPGSAPGSGTAEHHRRDRR